MAKRNPDALRGGASKLGGGSNSFSRQSPANPVLEAKLKAAVTLPEFLQAMEITTWDFLIVGDGSATQWKHAGGWASVLYRRDTGARKAFFGGCSAMTNIVAELMAYVHPLLWLSANCDNLALKHLHICTDCEYLVNAGRDPDQRRANAELWATVEAFRRRNLRISWHWLPRDVASPNKWAHDAANASRESAKAKIASQPPGPFQLLPPRPDMGNNWLPDTQTGEWRPGEPEFDVAEPWV